MLTVEDYAKQPFEARLARMTRTPDELDAAIHDQTDAGLSGRPDAKNWAAKEVICHLRDTEEVFLRPLPRDRGERRAEDVLRSRRGRTLRRGQAVLPK